MGKLRLIWLVEFLRSAFIADKDFDENSRERSELGYAARYIWPELEFVLVPSRQDTYMKLGEFFEISQGEAEYLFCIMWMYGSPPTKLEVAGEIERFVYEKRLNGRIDD